jgi:SAM-dependent methyltransferase
MPVQANHDQPSQPESSSSVFNEYARYYDLLYQDKDYPAEADYVDRLIRRFHPKAQSILELGSGTGIHACLLAQKGFAVHGVERSTEMIATARQNAIHHPSSQFIDSANPLFIQGDIRHIRLNQRFDAVSALFHVMSYQITNDDVLAAFQTARHHLNSGGIFIFDVWYGPAVLTDRPAVRIKRMANDEIEVTRLAEPVMRFNENRVDVNYHVFVRDLRSGQVNELKETHAMRYFFKPEIELFSNQSQFQLIHAEEWLTGKPVDETTWGACFCVQTIESNF